MVRDPYRHEHLPRLVSTKTDPRPQNKDFYKLFSPFSDTLPDMNILINLYDLPLGYVSYEERQRLIAAGRAGVCELLSFIPEESALTPRRAG